MSEVEDFPLIAPNDYAAFRNILGNDIPDTYDEWLKLQTEEIIQFGRAGRETAKIPVHSDEFARFLHSRGANANIVSLRNFTIEKAAGNSY
jgi:hypothetical protein